MGKACEKDIPGGKRDIRILGSASDPVPPGHIRLDTAQSRSLRPATFNITLARQHIRLLFADRVDKNSDTLIIRLANQVMLVPGMARHLLARLEQALTEPSFLSDDCKDEMQPVPSLKDERHGNVQPGARLATEYAGRLSQIVQGLGGNRHSNGRSRWSTGHWWTTVSSSA